MLSFLNLIKAPVEVVSVLKGLVEDGVRNYDHTTIEFGYIRCYHFPSL
jgi:hypothetical protein